MENINYYSTYYTNKHREEYFAKKVPKGAYVKAKKQEQTLERKTTLLSLVVLGIILLVSFWYV